MPSLATAYIKSSKSGSARSPDTDGFSSFHRPGESVYTVTVITGERKIYGPHFIPMLIAFDEEK